MTSLRVLSILLTVAALAGSPAVGQADNFADYHMVLPGHTWQATNYDHPGDQFMMTTSGWVNYHGYEAVQYHITGDPSQFLVCRCDLDADMVTMLAIYDEPDTNDYEPAIAIGEFEDGQLFEVNYRSPQVIWMLRYWDNVPPAIQDTFAYAIPSTEGPVAFWVTYDCAVPTRNRQNDNVEAGLPPEFVPPQYAVTDLWWFEKGKGNILRWGVNSDTGDLTVKYQMTVIATPVEETSWGRLKALFR